MASDPLHILTPEEEELQRKRLALEAAEQDLAEQEVTLKSLEAQVLAFERIYMEQIGPRYAQLDEMLAETARRRVQAMPDDPAAREAADAASEQAAASAHAVHLSADEPGTPNLPLEATKKLYRDVAKLIHPDLTLDDDERIRRTELMARANRAFREGDREALEYILRDWKSSPEAITGNDPAAELVRSIRKLAQVERRQRAIAEDITWLLESELYKLQTLAERAAEDGRALLDEMALHLDAQIDDAQAQLDALPLPSNRQAA